MVESRRKNKNTKTPLADWPDTLQKHSFIRSPTALSGHLCLSLIRSTSYETALFGHLSLSLTIRIKFNFTVHCMYVVNVWVVLL
jgi:hypothetical protein